MARRSLATAVGAIAVVAALLSLPAAGAATSPLSAVLGAGTTFPARTVVLSAQAKLQVSGPLVTLAENGRPVDHLTVTPDQQTVAAPFGVVLVIDRSASMSGAPLAHALAAARALATQRTGSEELGVITFASRPTAVLPLTSDPRAIGRVLSRTPSTGTGTEILPAVTLALKQLADAKVADGAVILLSDGAASGSAGGLTLQSVGAAARAQHVPLFTVGLQARPSDADWLRSLARLGGGKFIAAVAPEFSRVFASIASGHTRRYVIRYESVLTPGQRVAVEIRVQGAPTPVRLSYYAPAPAAGATPSSPGSTSPKPSSSTSSGSTSSGSTSSGSTSSGSTTPHPSSVHPSAAEPTLSRPQKASPIANPFRTSRPFAASPGSHATAGDGTPTYILAPVPAFAQYEPAAKPTPDHPSFWTSSIGLMLVAGGCALLLGLAIAILLYHHRLRGAVRRRVGDFLAASHGVRSQSTDAGGKDGPISALLIARRWWPKFVEQVHTARLRRSAVAVVKRTTAAALLTSILVVQLTGSVALGLLAVLATPFLLRAWVQRAARRQRNAFAEQLPSHLQDIAGAMRAGRSFVGALSAVAETAVEPMRGELERAVSDERLGLPLEDTLGAIGQRMAAKDMDQVALIAALHRNSGSNVAEALDRVAEGARERADMVREMRALTGQARISSWVLTGLPPAMLVALSLVSPEYARPLLHTTGGIVLLMIAGGMVLSGWFVMHRIVTIEA